MKNSLFCALVLVAASAYACSGENCAHVAPEVALVAEVASSAEAVVEVAAPDVVLVPVENN